MSNTSEILFEYLRDILYNSSEATLDINKLDEDFVMLGKGLMYFAQCFAQYNELANALAKGDLSVKLPPPENELAAPLKSLHASLKHLTWQSQQVAIGDYKQRVDFMGDFSEAFNKMIEQLAERQKKLEEEIETTHKKSMALEQSNQLLTNITQYIPNQIIVIDSDTSEILLMNDIAKIELENDSDYIHKLMGAIPNCGKTDNGRAVEIQYINGTDIRYLLVNTYFLEWNNLNAKALVVDDISVEKAKMEELETYAYRDTMTHLYNRFFGMLMLNKWLGEKKQFALMFADLDNLKYINDNHGHNEGDIYIIKAAKYLKTFSEKAIVCRIGGDEFMLLIPDMCYDDVYERMNELYHQLRNDEYLKDKEYYYSISFGIVSIDEDNKMASSDILSIADERMYEHKRMRKKNRQT